MNKMLRDQVMQLPAEERLELITELWESIHPPDSLRLGEPFVLTEEQMAELDRRLSEHEQNPDRGESWELVRARLWARFDK